ncbi:MAG: serine/threonine-protein kinase [Pseudomonadota bacterium]|nr:serine/threonine protein kinase [Pseudomonadales bacterium]MDY6922200.1 serine/threonine-protein kinase [Pseudomonadota bacterium]
MMQDNPSPLRQIAKYAVEGILGSGAMGVVYKAMDRQIERPVAIKVLHQHLRNGEHGADLELRFLQEARAAARCLHPNIVTIFDFGSDQQPYIVMEFVEGIELKAHLRSDTFISLPSATDICIQVLEALNHAHDKGIVHRDIKPANIILLENGNVKVSDFGVARLDTSDLTSTGFMVGTPNYMSPEGLQGRPVDARSDLYSVGVLFYELLTRERPARERDLEGNMERLSQVSHLSGQNVRSIKHVLGRALQPDPAQRVGSAAEFISLLKAIDDMDLTQATTAHFPRPADYQAPTVVEPGAYSSSQWNDDLLLSLEHSLARYVGPMARLLVRKSSRSATSLEQLMASLTRHIPNADERSQFMQAVEQSGVSQATGTGFSPPSAPNSAIGNGSQSPPAPVVISEQTQQQLSELLAFHIGPLASRLVKKLARQHGDVPALVEALARQIPDPKERNQFLLRAGKLS